MADDGASHATMDRVRLTLKAAYRAAMGERLVTWNPVDVDDLIPESSNPGRPSRAMTPTQLEAFLAAAAGDDLEACWLTMLGVGLRPGEVTGLRWADLELDAKPALVHVRQARVRMPGGGVALGGGRYDGLKTDKSRRDLELPDVVVAALRRHGRRQAEGRLAAGSLWEDNDLVFPTSTGRPIIPESLRRRFAAVTEAAGLGRWHPHELRHTWVSLCCDAGVELLDMADAAGHATTVLTEGVYRKNLRPTVGSQARAAMDGLLGRSS